MLTLMLLLISLVVLLVSGIGIMNIMLATVSSRIREIGVRKAVGATNQEISFSSCRGFVHFTGGRDHRYNYWIGASIFGSISYEYRMPISGLSAIMAICVSTLVGIACLEPCPATRAANWIP